MLASTLAGSAEEAAKKAQEQADIGAQRVGSSRYQQTHMAMIFQDGLSFSGFERNKLFLGTKGGTFRDLSDVSGADSEGDCRAVAAADFDDDGDIDLFVNAIQRECHMLFRNDAGSGGGHGFVKVQLRASAGHPDAIGAIVKVKVGDEWQARVLSSGGGFESQAAPELVFGLGAAESAEIRVRWPGRAVESFGTVPAGSRCRLKEGSGAPQFYDAHTFTFKKVRPRGLRVDEGEQLPELGLVDLDGKKATVPNGDAPLLLNFWQTTCAPCVGELPLLQKLKDRGDYRVMAVSLDRPDRAGRVREIWQRLELGMDVSIIEADTAERLFDLDRLAIPVSFVVSPEGKILRIIQGLLKEDDL